MSASNKALEKRLLQAGKKLLDPWHSSVQNLLQLLDKLFLCLSEVEQSPPDSMQNALSPFTKALVAERLFKHSNIDVKVAVAACICQITRITAPDAPYDDHQMKEVFKLIVTSFEHLADFTSCSYAKRILILETVSDIRLCSVMLDLECDAQFIQMFQHFLKAIRDHHPARIFLLMVTIMTLVLEESEDITPEMLSPILQFVKKDDKKIPQISRRLAEQVLVNCASKHKKYLAEAVIASGVPLDKYSNVVASICEGEFSALKQKEVVAHTKQDKQKASELSTPEKTDAPKDGVSESRVSNGVAQIPLYDSWVDTDFSKKQDEPQLDNSINSNLDKTIGEKIGVEDKTKKNGKQPSSVKQLDSLKDLVIKEETEPLCDSSLNATSVQDMPSDTSADETTNVNSTSWLSVEGHLEESRLVKVVNQKNKESSMKEAKPSATSVTKEISEKTNISEAKFTQKSGEKVASSSKANPAVPPSKESTSETKAAKQSEKKAAESDNVQESSKRKEETKNSGGGKAMDEESLQNNEKPAVSSASKSKKEVKQPSEETLNTNTKRKHSLGKEKASNLQDYGENLVGSNIKILWPDDRTYYEAVVVSYDSAKKTHKVIQDICDDDDGPSLDLKKEKWYFVDESESSEDEANQTGDNEVANQTGDDEEASTMPQKKKAKTSNEKSANKQSKMDIPAEKLSPIPPYAKKDDEVPQVSRRFAVQVLTRCASQLKTSLTEAVKSSNVSRLSTDTVGSVVDSICEGAFNALTQEEVVANEKEDKQKAAEVSTPEQSCVPKKRPHLEHSLLSVPHDSSVNAIVSSINENGHGAVSPRHETVYERRKTQERKIYEMVQVPVEEENPAETETRTYKRARVQSGSLHKAYDEIEKTAAEKEPSSRINESSAEPGDLPRNRHPQPCSISDQLAKVKQSIVDAISSVRRFGSELEMKEQGIVDTLSSVRQFKTEIKQKEVNLEASLQEIDVLGEKIMGINKILNS